MPKQGVKNKKYNDKDKEDKEIKVKKKNFNFCVSQNNSFKQEIEVDKKFLKASRNPSLTYDW